MNKLNLGDTEIEFGADPQGAEITVGESKFQVDHEGNFVGGQVFGNVVEKVEGGLKVTRPDGVTVVLHESGGATVENLIPKSVGIRDLSEVESYAVRTWDQTRIHRIDFVGGGHVEVTYSADGQVSEVTGQNIQQSITKDGEIIVSQRDSASGPVH